MDPGVEVVHAWLTEGGNSILGAFLAGNGTAQVNEFPG